MIKQISINSVNSKSMKKQPQFKGVTDVAISGIQLCESIPMVNVALLDLLTAIGPRTVVEGQTNLFAGMEAFRRESSGLIINCMIPGLIVAGIAKLIQNKVMGRNTQMGSCLANDETINLVKEHWQNTTGDTRSRVKETIRSILGETKGLDGKKTVDFSQKGMNFEKSLDIYTDLVMKSSETQKGSWFERIIARHKANNLEAKQLSEAYQAIVNQTLASENIKIGSDKFFSQNLKSVLDNSVRILKELSSGKEADISTFVKRASNLVKYKSLAGMAVILPIAIAAQPINRWITAKTSGKKGAPIYNDFSKAQCKELSSKDKAALFRQKLISVGSMVGVAFLSMGCKLPGMKVLQFSGLFPTMDQARIISTATFASRMMASEDKNDLREATFRDIATFSSFYFLGDYVAKGIASLIQKNKPEYTLINVKKELKPNANIWDQIVHWTKDTALKSSDEVHALAKNSSPEALETALKNAKKMRSVCQLGNIAFSLISLGIVIPKLYRHKTEKEHQKELANNKN